MAHEQHHSMNHENHQMNHENHQMNHDMGHDKSHIVMGHMDGHNISMNDTYFMRHDFQSDNSKEMKDNELSGHSGHSGHSMMGSMAMTFHGGCDETILFSWWKVTEVGEFVGSFVAIFIMALFYEGLKYYRKHLLWKTYAGLQYCAVSPPDKGVTNVCAPDEPQIQPVPHVLERNVPSMLSMPHCWQTLLHGLQVLVSYVLMLVFMTYNTWLCAAVVLGSATGYFLFGWRESVIVDFTEHCH